MLCYAVTDFDEEILLRLWLVITFSPRKIFQTNRIRNRTASRNVLQVTLACDHIKPVRREGRIGTTMYPVFVTDPLPAAFETVSLIV